MNNMTRWNPFQEIAEMQRQFDRVLDDAWRDSSKVASNWMPIDVTETDDVYTVIADLPGLTVDDITVNFHDGVLSIAGEVEKETVDENSRLIVRERSYGKFNRRINLPTSINADDINATYEDGVLMLTLPKAEAAKPRQIHVKKQNLLDKKN